MNDARMAESVDMNDARMAESVDALVSNTNVRKDVPVRPRLRVHR